MAQTIEPLTRSRTIELGTPMRMNALGRRPEKCVRTLGGYGGLERSPMEGRSKLMEGAIVCAMAWAVEASREGSKGDRKLRCHGWVPSTMRNAICIAAALTRRPIRLLPRLDKFDWANSFWRIVAECWTIRQSRGQSRRCSQSSFRWNFIV